MCCGAQGGCARDFLSRADIRGGLASPIVVIY